MVRRNPCSGCWSLPMTWHDNFKSARGAAQSSKERTVMSLRLSACSAFVTAFFGLALTATTPAHAYVEAGSLNCRSSGPAGFVVVSARVFDCVFAPASGAPLQYYRGTISRFGAQIGFTNDVALGWIVLAATSRVGPGALAGGYVGVSAGGGNWRGAGAHRPPGRPTNPFPPPAVTPYGHTSPSVS